MEAVLEKAREVIDIEARAVAALRSRIDAEFGRAVELVLGASGRVVVTGMGKSGLIGQKIVATLCSTGTPALFLHPAEGIHGDLGMLVRGDVVVAISNSGETEEVARILPVVQRLGMPLIAMTRPGSTLARAAGAVLDISVAQEACPLGLAPTASTTATLAMGDALAVALLVQRGFQAEDFALFHPGGSLGKRLLLRVRDVMHRAEEMPRVAPQVLVQDALFEITARKMGITGVFGEAGELVGVFTDGDLRRTLEGGVAVLQRPVGEFMTRTPRRITAESLAIQALSMMHEHSISSVFVFADETATSPEGIVTLYDLLRAGLD